MNEALRDLIRISRAVGGDPRLVQGGGGNTSVKTADGAAMYIKASGSALREMDERRGWCLLDVKAVRSILTDPSLAELPEADREQAIVDRLQGCRQEAVEEGARPSVESHLHALLGRCVVHLHPVAVGAYVCAEKGREALAARFAGEEPPPLWVPYASPGWTLATKVSALVGRYERRWGQRPAVLFLAKHGLLVTAEMAHEVVRLVRRVIARCEDGLRWRPRPRPLAASEQEVRLARLAFRRGLWEATGCRQAVRRFADEDIAAFLSRRDAPKLASSPPLTPDELAYAGNAPLWLEECSAEAARRGLARQLKRGERPSASALAPRVGLLAAGTEATIPVVKEVVTAALLVRAHAARLGGAHPLTRPQREFICRWEGERYRREVAAGRSAGELAGHIAVVSGAGSGLGRSIALGLARAGALVALADVDAAAAEETESLIRAELPRASALAVRCDVTNEQEVARCYAAVAARWGGLDILVNAAGLAPAHPLVEFPLERWRRALEVNLTGYFLMAREAARLMIEQGMGGSIINLSSKSGLEASRSNTAYNATKAGEIHMARGWALELGGHGIRVNSVAPGNVFEGSRIWNREYIEACARKCGIKPEEVIPYYVNKTALKRRITGQDVAEAVVFLCSERARTITGQTLVPDSGQVMVR